MKVEANTENGRKFAVVGAISPTATFRGRRKCRRYEVELRFCTASSEKEMNPVPSDKLNVKTPPWRCEIAEVVRDQRDVDEQAEFTWAQHPDFRHRVVGASDGE